MASPVNDSYRVDSGVKIHGGRIGPTLTLTAANPVSGNVGVASNNFTVTLVNGVGSVIVTPASSPGSTLTPSTRTLTVGSPTGTFTLTPSVAGAHTVSITNNGAINNPNSVTYTGISVSATVFTLTGPTTGTSGQASTNFTVTPNGTLGSTVVVTPAGTGATFSPTSLTFTSGSSSAQTFTVTRATDGATSVSITNNGGLSNAGTPISYTSSSASATTLTLSGPTTGTTGQASTFTVTPNATMGSTVVVTPAGSGATFSPTTITFTSGSSASHTFTATRATDGTTSISITNNGGLSNAGTPISFTSSAAVSNGLLPTTTTLTPGVSGTIPFSIGQGFIQGSVTPGSTLAGLQLNTISTWPDGSTRFGIVSGTASMTSGSPYSLSMTLGAAAGGATLTTSDLKTALTQPVSISTSTHGSASWSGTDWDSPFNTWATGPVMSSWIYRKQVGSDAHLVAWLEVRLWNTGTVEILPWIENGYLLVSAPTNKNDTYQFTMGGTTRLGSGLVIDLPHHCRTPLVNGTALSHWLSTDFTTVVKHDVTYLQHTELVPSYYATVNPSDVSITSQPSTYTPLQQGSYSIGMGNAGYQPAIGLLPEWDVLYLTSTAPSLWGVVQRQGYSAGRYGIHYRDENTNLPPRALDHQHLSFNGTGDASLSDIGLSSTGEYTPAASGTVPPTWDTQHHPSMGYMAALLTGRYYHVETSQFVASFQSMKDYDDYGNGPNGNSGREGIKGLMKSQSPAFSHRGAGWAFRTLAQAVTISKDGSTTKTELTRVLDCNIDYYYNRYYADNLNNFGFVEGYLDQTITPVGTTGIGSTTSVVILDTAAHGGYTAYDNFYVNYNLKIGGQSRLITAYDGMTRGATVSPAFSVAVAGVAYECGDNLHWSRTWMGDFFNAGWGYLKALQPVTTKSDRINAFYHWNTKSVVGRFGLDNATDFLYRDAVPYNIPVAPSDHMTWGGSTSGDPWFNNWGEIWTALQSFNPSIPTNNKALGDGSLRCDTESGDIPTNSTGYWSNVQPALSYAVRHNVAGAEAAYGRMTMAPNWTTLRGNWNTAAVWSVKPWNPPQPTWLSSIAQGDVAALTNTNGKLANHFRDAAYTSDGYSSTYALTIVDAYSGSTKNPYWGTYGSQIFYGSGHAASNVNATMIAEYGHNSITFKRIVNPTNWFPANPEYNEGQGVPDTSWHLDEHIPAVVDLVWGESLADGKPTSIHSYGHPFVVGPEYGGATYGSYWLPIISAGAASGYVGSLSSHKLDFTSLTPNPATMAWSRSSTEATDISHDANGWGGPVLGAFVPSRMRCYLLSCSSGAYVPKWLDLTTGTYHNGSGNGFSYNFPTNDDSLSNGNGHMVPVPAREIVVFGMRRNGVLILEYYNSAVDQPTKINVSLSSPISLPQNWSCLSWASSNNRLLVGGAEAGAMYEISLPMDLSQPWTVTRVPYGTGTFTPIDVSMGIANSFNKFAVDTRLNAIVYFGRATQFGDDTVYVYKLREF